MLPCLPIPIHVRLSLLVAATLALSLLFVVPSKHPGPGLATSHVPRRLLLEQQEPPPITFEFDSKDPHLAKFEVSDYTVLGPTQFPEPTLLVQRELESRLPQHTNVEVAPILKPRIGVHRPEQDAVFAFASEYGLPTYQGFVLSLRKTGFQGDIVLALSPSDFADPGQTPTYKQEKIQEFLEHCSHVVIYVVPFVCYNSEGEPVDSAKGGIRTCDCNVLYGSRTSTSNSTTNTTEWQPLLDVRGQRPVATTRYELYWIWSRLYQPHTWQMLVDARDTFFQSNPFATVPRDQTNSNNGLLYFFGENADATRIGRSDKNRKWLTTAYGDEVIRAMQYKPTICSGATIGEQMALETYLRAMVNEFDETGIVLMGADQGFHNFLYYSGKLRNADRIRSILVFDQGRGIVNNMGAMRTKALEKWGNGRMVVENADDGTRTVLNWDGTPSPVVHQFDRFNTAEEGKIGLGSYFYKQRTQELVDEFWNELPTKQQKR
jgi:hypothetical protein